MAACHVLQNQVHGLLGQRAISPAPMKQPPIEQLGGGTKEQSEFAAQATTTIAAALGLGGGGVGTSTTIRATVQADGHLQGEGAIEGSYRDYQVGSPALHTPQENAAHAHRTTRILACTLPFLLIFPLCSLQVKWVSSHGPGAFAFSRFTECMDDGRQ